jgi:hypothetical protein
LLVVAAVAALAVSFGATSLQQWLVRTFAILCVIGLALVLYRRMQLGVLSPVAIVIVTYVAIALIGPLAAGAVEAGNGVSARIALSPNAEQGAFLVLITAAGATALGACLYSFLRPVRAFAPADAVREIVPMRIAILAAALASVVPLLLQIAAFGPGLVYRHLYLGDRSAGDPLVVAAQVLALPSIALLGWLYQVSPTRQGKRFALFVVGIYAITLFSLGTRTLALLPPMLILGMIAARPESPRLRVFLVLAAAASLPILQIPLTVRGNTSHGLVPYLGVLSHGISFDLTSVASNVLFAFQLTGYVAFSAPHLDVHSLLISLDPRSGAASGWYGIEPQLRINIYTPYNALGELGNYGWLALVGFYTSLGVYLCHLENHVRRLLFRGQGLFALPLFALACLFLALTLEYNLRSCVRILYYLFALELAIPLALWIANTAWFRRQLLRGAAQNPDHNLDVTDGREEAANT